MTPRIDAGALLCAFTLGCSHATIVPDDASKNDVVTNDAAPSPDANVDAGDGSTGPGDIDTSGSRLKIVVVTGADGSKQRQSVMLDTQTGCLCDWSFTPSVNTMSSTWTCTPFPGTCADGGAPSSYATGMPSTL